MLCHNDEADPTYASDNDEAYIDWCHAVWHDEASSHMVCMMTKQTIDDEAIK